MAGRCTWAPNQAKDAFARSLPQPASAAPPKPRSTSSTKLDPELFSGHFFNSPCNCSQSANLSIH
jgi:hypothetical protein